MDEQRKKVLYVITKDDVGGAQKYVADLAAHLNRASFDARIVRGGADIPSLSNRIRWYALFLNDWWALFSLLRLYAREKPDIIHLNSSKAGVVGSFAAGLYKFACHMSHVASPEIVFTAHGWVFNPSNKLSTFARFAYTFLHRLAAYFEDVIICVSEYDHALALERAIAPTDKLVVIHNGIDYQNISFMDKVSARREIVQKLNLKLHTLHPAFPWIGSIGRLTKEKDYRTLIEAAVQVPDAYFFIIGEGPEKDYLKSQISHAYRQAGNLKITDRFFIVPPTGADAKYLKAFDVFTLTSVKEGLPYALLEAGAAGIPAVVTDAGGMPEVVEHDRTGMVVPQKNPERLANAYTAVLSNPRHIHALGAEAAERIETQFGLKRMVEETEAVYRPLR